MSDTKKIKLRGFQGISMNYQIFSTVIILGALMFACSETQNPVADVSENGPSVSAESSTDLFLKDLSGQSVRVNNYDVTFNGKSYNAESDQSTFSYTVSGTDVEPALNFFFLETPACAGGAVTFSPEQSAKVGDNGITWESSIPTSGSRDYSITYSGDLPVGLVDATIESGNSIDTEEVPGPCKGIYTISGNVFVDGNTNQQKESTESGIRNVTVVLTDINGSELSQKTNLTGSYSFTVFTGSSQADFTIKVAEETTLDDTDFNEQLFETYTPTTLPAEKNVTVNNADVSGTDFGFNPQTQKIIQQFEDGTILLNTEEPKFWIKQFRFAKNNNSKAEIPAAELLGYLLEIENLLLDNPFKFGDNKIENALDILTKPTKTDLEELLVQLLTAELNVVSGRGSNSPDFDLALLAFGENAAAEESVTSGVALQVIGSVADATSTSTSTSTSDASSLLTSFNFSGGGGGGVGD